MCVCVSIPDQRKIVSSLLCYGLFPENVDNRRMEDEKGGTALDGVDRVKMTPAAKMSTLRAKYGKTPYHSLELPSSYGSQKMGTWLSV